MDESSLKLASPLWVWVALALAIFSPLLWVVSRRMAEQRMGRFVGSRFVREALASLHWPGLRLRFALPAAVLALLAVVLARPLFGPRTGTQEREGVDVVIALDVSRSMTVDDVFPSRLTAAKKAMSEWMQGLSGDRIGLVVFAGDAFVQAPITSDYIALDQVLKQVGPRSVSLGGTNIPRAIEVAARMFERQRTDMKAIVIVTDGENFQDDAIAAARQAREKGISIFSVGVGTPQGGKVFEDDYAQYEKPPQRRSYQSDGAGSQAFSKLDERTLRAITQAGGGSTYLFDPALKTFSVLRDQGLAPLAQKGRRVSLSDYVELFQIPLLMGIVLLVLEPLIRTSRRKSSSVDTGELRAASPRRAFSHRVRSTVKMLILFVTACSLQQTFASGENVKSQVEVLLAGEKKEEAVEVARQNAADNDGDFYALYNYAVTLYRAGKYEEAGRNFQFVESMAPEPALRAKASIQIGNALYRRGESLIKEKQLNAALASLEESLSQFEKVESAYPSRAASTNRESTRVLLDQLLRTMTDMRLKNAEMFANKNEPWREEEQLTEASQLVSRLAELNPKAPDIPPKQKEVKEKLAASQLRMARRMVQEADSMAGDKRRFKETIYRRKDAINKYEQIQAAGNNAPQVQAEKQAQQDKISEQYLAAISPRVEPILAKEDAALSGNDEKTLREARASIAEAKNVNPQNQAVNGLDGRMAEKLSKLHQSQGEKALEEAGKEKSLPRKLSQTQNAADQFQKALEQNPGNETAQKKMEDISKKLPDMLKQVAQEELAQAEQVLEKTSKPEEKKMQLREAIGHLEKSTQTFDAAVALKPNEEDIEKQKRKADEMLAASRQEMQKIASQTPSDRQEEKKDSPEGIANNQKLGELNAAKRKESKNAKTEDAFWQRNYKDW